MRDRISLTNRQKAGWILALWALLMVRACAAGLEYWPQLDDYIQYHNYPTAESFSALQKAVGLLASRPLAGIADYFIWGRMFGFMLVGVAIISLLYAVTTLVLWSVLGRFFRIGPLFPVIVALLPLGVEGTYWMSASTRVVVGMFWAALAAWLFLEWMDGPRRRTLAAFLVCQLLPFGFYEQAGILAVTLTVGVAILRYIYRAEDRKKCLLALWAPASTVLYLLLTKLLSNGGVYGSRAALILPVSRYYFTTFLPDILGQIRKVFLNADLRILMRGFVRTAGQLLQGRLLLWFAVTAALCAGVWQLGRKAKTAEGRLPLWLQLVSGLLLAAAPVTLFLILDNPWFSLRGAVTSFPGLALIADCVMEALWKRAGVRREVPALLAALCALVFCMAGASEIADYRDTYRADQQAARAVLDTIPADLAGEEGWPALSVGILGLEPTFLPRQNYLWHEHVTGCTESSWAFSGLVGSLADGLALPSLSPLPSSPLYRRWNAEANRPDRFDRLYYYNGTVLEPVTLEQTGEKAFNVLRADGSQLGHIWEEPDGLGYFALEQP